MAASGSTRTKSARRAERPPSRLAVTDLPSSPPSSLCHTVCWMIAYPIAGFVGARLGVPLTFVVLAVLTAVGVGIAWKAMARKRS
ncbi:protein of unknown function (plasmid) [Caballeronia sp. S22]